MIDILPKDLRLGAGPAQGSEVHLARLVELHQGPLSSRAVLTVHQRIVDGSK